MKWLRAIALLILAAALCVCGPSTRSKIRGADTSDADQPTQRAAESQQLASAEVLRFEFFLAEGQQKLKLRLAPVHRFTHQHNCEVYTNLFIWTHQGRPEAIASISNWFVPRPYHGLAVTSLSTEKLIGSRDAMEIWRPQSAGVKLKPVPDAPRPNKTEAARLRQMRALAREFKAEFRREPNFPENGELRLLSTPLYRYQSENAKLIDGAIFGFASGTAPQLVLLIEARQSVSGPRWDYALAPRNSTQYRVWHKGKEVWSLPQLAPPWPNSKNPTNTYTVFHDLQREGRTQEFVEQLLKVN